MLLETILIKMRILLRRLWIILWGCGLDEMKLQFVQSIMKLEIMVLIIVIWFWNDKQSFRFSTLQTLFPTIHAEITRGTKEEVLAYFEKSGKHEEKAHTIVVPMKLYGELRANQQGQRSDLDYIQRRIEEGSTPEEIMIERLEYRKYTKMIKEHYYQVLMQNTPYHKDLKVYWHTGDSGSGKSYTQVELKREFGREAVYVWSDYQNGGLDGYQGESILFMEEYKAELPYAEFLKVTDRYPQQMHARYSNVYALWNTIHLTSIFPLRRCMS